MKTREEIIKHIKSLEGKSDSYADLILQGITINILLDIRDLLTKDTNETD